jgi:hypothetical protein
MRITLFKSGHHGKRYLFDYARQFFRSFYSKVLWIARKSSESFVGAGLEALLSYFASPAISGMGTGIGLFGQANPLRTKIWQEFSEKGSYPQENCFFRDGMVSGRGSRAVLGTG